jgi:RimJ/RimL family protein N-acetyltransferase
VSTPPLHSARLALRLPRPDDAPFILELLTDPDWLRNIGDRGVRSEADAARYIEERLLASFRLHAFGLWVVEPSDGGKPLGLCGLVKRDYLEDVDIGFAMLPAARGKGHALEAARRVLQFVKEDLRLPRLAGIVVPDNTASVRLLKQLGLVFQRQMDDRDTAVDLYLMQLR